MKLGKVEKWAKTKLPKDREDFNSKKVAVCLHAYRFKDIKCSHLSRDTISESRRGKRKLLTITAGSLVLIPRSNGTTFSWMVYLSKIEALELFGFGASITPVRPSPWIPC